MVHFLAILIFLLPIVTILGSEFWHDVDKKHKELSDPQDMKTQASSNDSSDAEDLPTRVTISEAQQVGPLTEGPRPNNRAQRGRRKRNDVRKHGSFHAFQMRPFNLAVIIHPTYPKNLSQTDIVNKLVELGDFHEWPQLRKFNVDFYSKYWSKMCTFFSQLNLTGIQRVACRLTPSFKETQQRKSFYKGRIQSFDLLGCTCHGYQTNSNIPATTKESFLIHQSSANEFFIFEHKKHLGNNELYIKSFKGGITIPYPDTFKWLNS